MIIDITIININYLKKVIARIRLMCKIKVT